MSTLQDAQIFKERYEDSPGILLLCQGDWRPTPDRIRLFEEQNYFVLTAANGFQDITDWLPQPRCMGAMFGHANTVLQARQAYPDKLIERFEGVGARFLRTLTQELPFGLHNAGAPFTSVVPAALKTVDVVSVFSPVALKRGQLLMNTLLNSSATAYVFAQSLGADAQLLASFLDVVKASGKRIEYFNYPFDPYALMRIDDRIVIDGRPIGANNNLVSGYLARARIFVHTSMTEGISNSVMEALLSDVPVLICDDIRGPLQDLSIQLPQCIYRSPPNESALSHHIKAILAESRDTGIVRNNFLKVINPFEINRRIVTGAQAWFAQNGIPWKGHCLGLMGGVQSKIDLATVNAEESYRGYQHIYPSPKEAVQCNAFQSQIAVHLGRADHGKSLLAESKLFVELMQSQSNSQNSQNSDGVLKAAEENVLDHRLALLAQDARIKQVVVIGAAAVHHWQNLVQQLVQQKIPPQIYLVESSERAAQQLAKQFKTFRDIQCLHGSLVPLEGFVSEAEVTHFYHHTPDKLQGYSLDQILSWRQSGIADMQTAGVNATGIQTLLELAALKQIDLLVLDGREFTGVAELNLFMGANLILLGCTRTLKNMQNTTRMMANSEYELLISAPNLGNGYAVFAKKKLTRANGFAQGLK